ILRVAEDEWVVEVDEDVERRRLALVLRVHRRRVDALRDDDRVVRGVRAAAPPERGGGHGEDRAGHEGGGGRARGQAWRLHLGSLLVSEAGRRDRGEQKRPRPPRRGRLTSLWSKV